MLLVLWSVNLSRKPVAAARVASGKFFPFVLEIAPLNSGSRVDLSGFALQIDEIFPISEMIKHGSFNSFPFETH